MVARVVVLSLTAVSGAAPAVASADELGPTPQICNVFAPTPNCFFAAVSGTHTFNLGGHILFSGEQLSGTYRWEIGGQGAGEFPSYGAVTALTDGGDPPAALHNWLNLPNNAGLAGTLPTDITSLVGTLGTAIHTANLRSAFVLTPVQTPKGYQGLLMSPEGSRVKLDLATGAIGPSSTGFVLTPNELNGKSLYAGGFWGYMKTTGTPAAFATLSQWLAGATPGYSYPGNAGPITLLNASRLQYAGFGYGPACT